jgi:hypothetical protein
VNIWKVVIVNKQMLSVRITDVGSRIKLKKKIRKCL